MDSQLYGSILSSTKVSEERVTPYMHIMAMHVHEMIALHGNLNNSAAKVRDIS